MLRLFYLLKTGNGFYFTPSSFTVISFSDAAGSGAAIAESIAVEDDSSMFISSEGADSSFVFCESFPLPQEYSVMIKL